MTQLDPNIDSQLWRRIDELDTTLFDGVEAQTSGCDRRSLLGLHAAAARSLGSFNYLEIGSYHGGSLQVVMQDPRCAHVISIDSRQPTPPDKRHNGVEYPQNTTEEMLALLRALPNADMSKLTVIEASTEELTADDLPVRPDVCFIDGEHTDEAVLRDAQFCMSALGGSGVLAFHDYAIVKPAVRRIVRQWWPEITSCVPFALAAGGGVFALELGASTILRESIVDRAIGSEWHSFVWRVTNRMRWSPIPFLSAWSVVPLIDRAVGAVRRGTS